MTSLISYYQKIIRESDRIEPLIHVGAPSMYDIVVLHVSLSGNFLWFKLQNAVNQRHPRERSQPYYFASSMSGPIQLSSNMIIKWDNITFNP